MTLSAFVISAIILAEPAPLQFGPKFSESQIAQPRIGKLVPTTEHFAARLVRPPRCFSMSSIKTPNDAAAKIPNPFSGESELAEDAWREEVRGCLMGDAAIAKPAASEK